MRSVALCLVVAAGMSSAVHAASLNVSPGSGPGGAPVSLSAGGFNEDYNTGFYVVGPSGESFIGACPPENRANCTLSVAQLPAYAPGTVTLVARNSAAQSGDDTFEIAPPSLSISPRCGPPGTTITVTGRFFALGPAAGVEFDGQFIPSSASNYPAGPTFSFSFPAPAMPDGRYPVHVSNSAGNSLAQTFLLGAECALVGEVTRLDGDGMYVVGPGNTQFPLGLGDPIRMNDEIVTPNKGGGTITFADNTQFSLSRNGRFKVDDFDYQPQQDHGQSFFSALQGASRYVGGAIGLGTPEEHGVIDTPAGAIGIRGTAFGSRYNDLTQSSEIYLTSGQVSITPYGTGLPQIFDAPIAITFDATTITSGPLIDLDTDGVPDAVDNCAHVANASQCDSDGDGYGNRCDGDFNDNGVTNAQDTTLFRQQLGQPSTAPGYNKADLNCNGTVNAQDTTLYRQLLGAPPGPSGISP